MPHLGMKQNIDITNLFLLRTGFVSALVAFRKSDITFQVLPAVCVLVGAIAELRKATTSFVISVCPSVRVEQLGSH
jgi:hypothetical protein